MVAGPLLTVTVTDNPLVAVGSVIVKGAAPGIFEVIAANADIV
jgi:hypothetical protein